MAVGQKRYSFDAYKEDASYLKDELDVIADILLTAASETMEQVAA